MAYRVMDVTLRDGSFFNAFGLDEQAHKDLATRLCMSGVDAVEVGYIGGLPEDHGMHVMSPGPAWDTPPSLIRALAQIRGARVVCMLHPERPVRRPLLDLCEIQSILVRVPVRPTCAGALPPETHELAELRIPFSVNLILGSWWERCGLAAAAENAARLGAEMVYIADTNSALDPHSTRNSVAVLSAAFGGAVGFHAHDARGLAHANVEAAASAGAVWIDATALGIGREAGNARTETLLHGAARDRFFELLPQIASSFGVSDPDRVWGEVAAHFDLCPACMALFARAAAARNLEPAALALSVLPGVRLPRPLTAAFLDALLG